MVKGPERVVLGSASWVAILGWPRRCMGAAAGNVNSFDNASELLNLTAKLRDR